MAKQETEIVHAAMKMASECGARVFKNVRGVFFAPNIFDLVIDAIKRAGPLGIFHAISVLRKTAPRIQAGLLCDDSSDLIGWQSITITPDMVGKRVAIFVAGEGKTINGKLRPGQANFIRIVLESGGKAGVFRNAEDIKNILK